VTARDRYRDRIPQPLCHRKGHRTHVGTTGYPPATEDVPMGATHASISVCARTECQEDAVEWVRAHTGHAGVFTTYEQNRAASAERRGKQPVPAQEAGLW
jgi:hypothetical protein